MGSPLSKKHKISLSYFQMCLMARLKALGILRWNLGSDIKLHDLRSSAMVLINVESWGIFLGKNPLHFLGFAFSFRSSFGNNCLPGLPRFQGPLYFVRPKRCSGRGYARLGCWSMIASASCLPQPHLNPAVEIKK